MCTPWTLSKLIRCRPCFSRYESPSSGAESETRAEKVPSAVATNASNRSTRRMVLGREPTDETLGSTEIGLMNKTKRYELHWHSGFEDEHYIVLCFGEDESVGREDDRDDLGMPPESGSDSGGLNTVSEDSLEDESEDSSSVGSAGTERHSKGEEHIERSPTESDQSEGSNSHGSKGSFSFPVLHKEWIGSPVQMPKPEDLRLRNHSGTHVCVHCCKF